jgi:hypothetical protein
MSNVVQRGMLGKAIVKIAGVSNDTGRFAELLVDEIRAV